MTLEGVYGTRPDLLPRSMVRLTRAEEQSGQRLAWVGRPGVEFLDLGEHLQYERDSIGRFRRSPDGAIEWRNVEDESVIFATATDSADLNAAIREYAPSSDTLIFLWSNITAPSVKMGPEVAATYMPEIIESMPEFWIYSPGDRVVVECSFSGTMTVARVPDRGE